MTTLIDVNSAPIHDAEGSHKRTHKDPNLQRFQYITTIDCDSLWQKRALPPKHAFGHSAAALLENPAGHENVDLSGRLNRLTYTYTRVPRDFAKIATPIRWPRGSPALMSLNLRLVPLVRGGKWGGGGDWEVVMNTVWDTFNNWGLREGINDATVHTPIPWYMKDKPLKAGSALQAKP